MIKGGYRKDKGREAYDSYLYQFGLTLKGSSVLQNSCYARDPGKDRTTSLMRGVLQNSLALPYVPKSSTYTREGNL